MKKRLTFKAGIDIVDDDQGRELLAKLQELGFSFEGGEAFIVTKQPGALHGLYCTLVVLRDLPKLGGL